jgi:hypothetical protein
MHPPKTLNDRLGIDRPTEGEDACRLERIANPSLRKCCPARSNRASIEMCYLCDR